MMVTVTRKEKGRRIKEGQDVVKGKEEKVEYVSHAGRSESVYHKVMLMNSEVGWTT